MPAPGSIELRLRVHGEVARAAEAELSGAGFITRSEEATLDALVVVSATRHAGVPSPDGDLQVAHHKAARDVLKAAGIDHETAGTAVVIEGSTNAALAAGCSMRE